jgi:hypothetical protein
MQKPSPYWVLVIVAVLVLVVGAAWTLPAPGRPATSPTAAAKPLTGRLFATDSPLDPRLPVTHSLFGTPLVAAADSSAETRSWKTYTSTRWGFKFKRPAGSRVEYAFESRPLLSEQWRQDPKILVGPGRAVLTVIVDDRSLPAHNGLRSEFRIGVTTDPAEKGRLMRPASLPVRTEMINGTPLKHVEFGEAGMMKSTSVSSYRALVGGRCFVIEKVVYSSHCFDTSRQAASAARLIQQDRRTLDQILKSFRFTGAVER